MKSNIIISYIMTAIVVALLGLSFYLERNPWSLFAIVFMIVLQILYVKNKSPWRSDYY